MGKPTVDRIQVFNEHPQLLSVLASLERRSEHPISKAICDFLKENDKGLELENFQTLSGKGLSARYSGISFFAGNLRWMTENKIVINSAQEKIIAEIYDEGNSPMFFANAKNLLAIIALSDKINGSAKQAIELLKSKGIQIYMLTGDNTIAAGKVAKALGIENFLAELLPSDKTAFVKNLRNSDKKVAMVGDGINDAAALANADLGIAMNGGTNIAIEAADVVLLNDNLLQISELIHISKRTMHILRQNLFWAFIYNILGIPIAAGLLYPFFGILLDPMIAGAAMAFSSVSVVLNSLRI
jgi:Cu2+-exporting ATPase